MKNNTNMDGILPVNKPVGMSSFDVIRVFKRANHPTYRVGHGGTLDPFADGVLLLLLGRATKKMNTLMTLPKVYRATAILGASSDTLDRTGTIVKSQKSKLPSESELIQISKKFVGTYEQEIPAYSAAKVEGRPRYMLAREGLLQDKKTKPVTIYSISDITVSDDRVTFVAQVGSGTYIRQLSYDLLKNLGIESYLETLSRLSIGDYDLAKCLNIDQIESSDWQDKLQPC